MVYLEEKEEPVDVNSATVSATVADVAANVDIMRVSTTDLVFHHDNANLLQHDEDQDESNVVEIPNFGRNAGQIEGTGWILSAMLIVNAALGAGLLNFPQAFHQAGGVVVALIVQSVLLVFIIGALIILAYCSDFNESKTLQEVLLTTWGKIGHKITSVCIAIYCFGTCITFLIIIGDQFDRVFESVYGSTFCDTWYMNRDWSMPVTSILFILPLCYSKKIDFLKHVSSVGVVAVIYVVGLIIVQYYTKEYAAGPIKTVPDAWTDVFLVVPVICFGYQCHVSVIPIYSCMKQRTLRQFSASVALAISICVFTYTVAATYGYLTFGSNITSDVLESYNPKDPSVAIAIVAVAVKTITTYPILLFCGREGISNLWLEFSLSRGRIRIDTPMYEKCRRSWIATVWFFSSILFAIFLPNIGAVIKLLGSLAAVFVFIFPGMCLLRIAHQQENLLSYERSTIKTTFLLVLCGIFLSVGAFLFGCVISQAILFDFIDKSAADIPLCTPSYAIVF